MHIPRGYAILHTTAKCGVVNPLWEGRFKAKSRVESMVKDERTVKFRAHYKEHPIPIYLLYISCTAVPTQ